MGKNRKIYRRKEKCEELIRDYVHEKGFGNRVVREDALRGVLNLPDEVNIFLAAAYLVLEAMEGFGISKSGMLPYVAEYFATRSNEMCRLDMPAPWTEASLACCLQRLCCLNPQPRS